jgi:hypothetical protein
MISGFTDLLFAVLGCLLEALAGDNIEFFDSLP